MKSKYGEKIAKITINGLFNCPNRDGTVAIGSCYFCSDRGSGDFAGDAWKQLLVQYEEQKVKALKKWPNIKKFIVYFQANTNTHDSVVNLKKRFEQFSNLEEVVAICIGTRPDCLPEDVLDYLDDLNKRKEIWIEIGLQTIHDETAKLFNRAYETKLFVEKVKELRKRKINIAVHLINSLPGETKEMMVDSVKEVCKLDIQSIKIHMLHIIKNSPWGLRYAADKWNNIMSCDNYIDTVCEQLLWIPPHINIQRLTGDPDKKQIINPLWTLDKINVLNKIDMLLEKSNLFQGMKLDKSEIYESFVKTRIANFIKKFSICMLINPKKIDNLLLSLNRTKKVYLVDSNSLIKNDYMKIAMNSNNLNLLTEEKLLNEQVNYKELDLIVLNSFTNLGVKTDILFYWNLLKKKGKIICIAKDNSRVDKQLENFVLKNRYHFYKNAFASNGQKINVWEIKK